jgi:hypothetical protein
MIIRDAPPKMLLMQEQVGQAPWPARAPRACYSDVVEYSEGKPERPAQSAQLLAGTTNLFSC